MGVGIELEHDYDNNTWNYIVEYKGRKLVNDVNINKAPDQLKTRAKMFTDFAAIFTDKVVADGYKSDLLNVLVELQSKVNGQIKRKHEDIETSKAKDRSRIVSRGKKEYQYFKDNHINVPQYILSVSRWLVAAEESNVMKVLLSAMNTARGEATNIISEASSGSGKTHIENAAFSLLHDHHYVILNHSTAAGFRNNAMTNEDLFKNKTVRLGDLGNEAAQDTIQEVLSIIKILNSEKVYHSQKTAKDGETVLTLTLNGTTAMCYSKVANNITIGDQDKSRGILYCPDPSNDDEFEKFAMWKNTPDFRDRYDDLIDGYVNRIKDYMEFLIKQKVAIINPYQAHISKILKKNKTYRRTLSKELWLLNSLALLNLPNKKIYEIEGKKAIFVSVEDVANYIHLYTKDLLVGSNYDMDIHTFDLFQVLRDDYIAIPDHKADNYFGESLAEYGEIQYDEYLFKDNKYFFSINSILERYRGKRELTNIISEVRDPKQKLRRVLNNMPNLVGIKGLTEEQVKGAVKPNLYFLIKHEKFKFLDELTLDKGTLNLFEEVGIGVALQDIIEDFMKYGNKYGYSSNGKSTTIPIHSEMSTILHHEDHVEMPPTMYISTTSKEMVDSLWSELIATNVTDTLYKQKPKQEKQVAL